MPKNIFYDPGPCQHGCNKSASVEIPAPHSPLVFCVDAVSCTYNEKENTWVLEIKTTVKKTKGLAYKKDDGLIAHKDKIAMTDSYTLDVTHYMNDSSIDTPIDVHSHNQAANAKKNMESP